MRIDPVSTIGGYPTLFVRKLMRQLSVGLHWHMKSIPDIAAVSPGEAQTLMRALEREGLVSVDRDAGGETWSVTQLGQSFASATAAKPITRQTAEKALSQFLERVQRVNEDGRFLGKVTKVVLFGSFLRAGVDRLGDVDIAVRLEPKEPNIEIARALNEERAADLAKDGKRFGNFLERQMCWYWETFRFLKGRSRSIALADYKAEKSFVDGVPHQVLLESAEEAPAPASKLTVTRRRLRRAKDCPF